MKIRIQIQSQIILSTKMMSKILMIQQMKRKIPIWILMTQLMLTLITYGLFIMPINFRQKCHKYIDTKLTRCYAYATVYMAQRRAIYEKNDT